MAELLHYDYKLSHKTKKNTSPPLEIYTFKNAYKHTIIVEVFLYEFNIYVIKFSQKNHRFSKDRYSLMYDIDLIQKSGYKNGTLNFFKTVNTVTKITIDLLQKNESASFGFMGAPRESEKSDENQENINEDNTIANTIRSRIYYLYCLRYFSDKKFEFIKFDSASIMILRNRLNEELTPEVAEKYLMEVVIPNL